MGRAPARRDFAAIYNPLDPSGYCFGAGPRDKKEACMLPRFGAVISR